MTNDKDVRNADLPGLRIRGETGGGKSEFQGDRHRQACEELEGVPEAPRHASCFRRSEGRG